MRFGFDQLLRSIVNRISGLNISYLHNNTGKDRSTDLFQREIDVDPVTMRWRQSWLEHLDFEGLFYNLFNYQRIIVKKRKPFFRCIEYAIVIYD